MLPVLITILAIVILVLVVINTLLVITLRKLNKNIVKKQNEEKASQDEIQLTIDEKNQTDLQ